MFAAAEASRSLQQALQQGSLQPATAVQAERIISEARADKGCTELIKCIAAAPSAISGQPSSGPCKIKATAAIDAGTVVGSTVEPAALAVALHPTAARP